MSVNKYNKEDNTLTTLASGQRLWIGTRAAHDAAVQAGTMPNNVLVAIVDDATENVEVVDIVEKENMSAVTSNAVAAELDNYLEDTGAQLLNGSLSFDESNTNILNQTIVLGQNYQIPAGAKEHPNGLLLLGNGAKLPQSQLQSNDYIIMAGNQYYTNPTFSVTSGGFEYLAGLRSGSNARKLHYHQNIPCIDLDISAFNSGDAVGIECQKIGDVFQIFNTHNAYDTFYNGEYYDGADDGLEISYGLQIGQTDSYDLFFRNPVILPLYYKTDHDVTSEIDSCNIFSYNGQSDGKIDLGSSNVRWKQIYATNATISTSDRNKKKEIEYFSPSSTWNDEELVTFVNDLKPCTYKLIENQSNRPHHGLIAQDVEETLQVLNKDHAGFIKSPVPVIIEEEKEYTVKELNPETGLEEEITKTKKIKRSVIPEYPSYTYSLRYEEFIPDLIRYCQLLEARVKELETKIGE